MSATCAAPAGIIIGAVIQRKQVTAEVALREAVVDLAGIITTVILQRAEAMAIN